MEKISAHISHKEATYSYTATRRGIDNSPTPEHLEAMRNTAKMTFEQVREHFCRPIGITSFYRSTALNEAIGGSQTSQHSKGEAIDVDADVYGGVKNSEIFKFIIENLDFDQLIWEFGDESEPDWIHVSYTMNGKNRRQALRAVKVYGKTVYKNY